MNQTNETGLDQVKFDSSNLYLEEVITDLRVGTIRRLTPLGADGNRDLGRPMMFFAQAQIMSQMGPLPVSGKIEATTLKEAIEKYPQAVQAGIEALMEEAREMQRQEASKIVMPGAEVTSKILGPR
ncbi:MAG: hypothetical protein DRJ61_12625 [Acidobacteria bacterium]|nr:MAG: hypothetical protein DRJ61_12625 [Acidobacteriota bacterium]